VVLDPITAIPKQRSNLVTTIRKRITTADKSFKLREIRRAPKVIRTHKTRTLENPNWVQLTRRKNEEMAALFNRVTRMAVDDQPRVINESLNDLGIEK
jgi:hypothetical protein